MKTLLRAAAAAGLVIAGVAHAAYPDKPIRIIVPYAPGGNIDVTARAVAPGLTEFLGQAVVVDNRGGAGGRVGTELAAKAPADGYTLLLGSNGPLTMTPAFFPSITYDTLRDFVPTSTVSVVPLVLSVHPSLPVHDTKQLVALAKQRAGRITMASAGTGSTTHMTGELFQLLTGVKFTHVPYKGSGPALIDLVGGQVDLIFDQISTSQGLIKAGKLRALGVATQHRSGFLPGVPTMEEVGIKGFHASTYTGIFLPATSPKDAVQKVYGALIKVLDQPATRESFARLGAEVIKSTPEEFTRRLKGDLARWVKVSEATHIKLE
ncbi:MAG: Bug family tripartite tricarboxylate transporter substrate binding protein [Rhodospirillaceae bacterium]